MKHSMLLGRIVFGIAFAIYGYVHFAFPELDMKAVPSYVGSPLFWVFFVGICWWATAFSFFTNVLTRVSGWLAALLLAVVYLTVHLKDFGSMPSLTSLGQILSMMGGSILVALNGRMFYPAPKKKTTRK